MKQEYIILSVPNHETVYVDDSDTVGAAGDIFMPQPSGLEPSFDPSEIKLTKEELSTAEAIDLERDPNNTLAPSMPMQAIRSNAEVLEESSGIENTDEATWGIEAIGAANTQFTGKGVTVAVLDSGIDKSHECFQGINIQTENFTDEVDEDIDGHGSHCAGTIFGKNYRGKRIGVAPNIEKALVAKVFGQGGGSSAQIARAIHWANLNGASIISMSMNINFPDFVDKLRQKNGYNVKRATSEALDSYRKNLYLFDSIARLSENIGDFEQGSLIVCASGNLSRRPDFKIMASPPASSKDILSVGAIKMKESKFHVAKFSNANVDLCAPGVEIESVQINSQGGGLKLDSGTSMATPHVAGIAALVAEELLFTGQIVTPKRLNNGLMRLVSRSNFSADSKAHEDIGEGMVRAPQYEP